jgi:hypothetical protein
MKASDEHTSTRVGFRAYAGKGRRREEKRGKV